MSKKRKQESKKDRKKRCALSSSIRYGIAVEAYRKKHIRPALPETFEEAIKMGILK